MLSGVVEVGHCLYSIGVILMNKNVMGIILIVVALALIYFFAWPRMKPYISPPAAPADTEMTTGTILI